MPARLTGEIKGEAMQVDFGFSLGDRVQCDRTGVRGVIDGFAVYSDGTLGACVAYVDANGVMQQQWRQLATLKELP